MIAASLGTASVALLASGCRESQAPRPPKAIVDVEPLDKAREAMDRREYRSAADFLRQAIARRPDDLEAHYRLGVTASHLDQAEQASQEFEWVVANGAPGAPEVQLARDWLASRRVGSSEPAPAVAAASAEAPVQKPDMATLAGRALGPEGGKPRLQLFLKGVLGTPVQDESHVLRTDQQGNFRFINVVPGEYMLTNVVAGPPTWRLKVLLAKGERLTLDLSPSNQVFVRDDFPESPPFNAGRPPDGPPRQAPVGRRSASRGL